MTDYTAEGGHGAVPTSGVATGTGTPRRTWPLYEVFVRGKRGLNHVHVGSLHAADDRMALLHARDGRLRAVLPDPTCEGPVGNAELQQVPAVLVRVLHRRTFEHPVQVLAVGRRRHRFEASAPGHGRLG